MTIDGTEQVSAQDTRHALGALLEEVRACRICEADLPLGPRPVLRAHQDAPILVVGQAPGTRVHATGIPWNDPSGKRLRAWLGVDDETFYDPRRFAIIPMGFCYPGRHPRGGDLPPRPECAAQWHAALLAQLPKRRLTLLIGDYAQRYYLGKERKKTLTGTVSPVQRACHKALVRAGALVAVCRSIPDVEGTLRGWGLTRAWEAA